MTPYEKADLFATLVNNGTNAMMNYISVLFTFLLVAYFIAPNLNRVMASIVVGLFSLFSVLMIVSTNRSLANAGALVDEIRKGVAAGETALAWHPVVSEPINLAGTAASYVSVLLVCSAIAAIVFFFQARKRTPSETLLSLK